MSALLLAAAGLALPLDAHTQQAAPPQPASAAAPAATQQLGQAPAIRRTTALVHLVAAVTDRRNRFITDLDRNDFRVFEDGQAQRIEFFSRQTDLPLRIGLLLDTSNSIRERLHFEQEAAIDFLYNVVRRGKDMAFLMTFDNEPQVIQDYTDDLSELSDAIRRQRAGGGTALDDAVYVAAQKLIAAPLPKSPDLEVRRVLVVISDGEDNLSDHALSDAIEYADRAEAAIYAISTNTEWLSLSGKTPKKIHKTEGDQVLEKFSGETGGRVFFPYRVDDLAQSFQDIGNELRSQYSIAYVPANPNMDGRFRSIRVQVDRKGLTVRTRRGYYAVHASASAENPSPSSPPY